MKNLSPAAQRSLAYARQEAERLSGVTTLVGSQHWVLGLRNLPDCGAMRLLGKLGIDLETLIPRLEMKAIEQSDELEVEAASYPYTAEFRKSVQCARLMAEEVSSSVLAGTEHILLSIIQEGDVAAAEDLSAAGLTWESASREIQKVQQRGPAADCYSMRKE